MSEYTYIYMYRMKKRGGPPARSPAATGSHPLSGARARSVYYIREAHSVASPLKNPTAQPWDSTIIKDLIFESCIFYRPRPSTREGDQRKPTPAPDAEARRGLLPANRRKNHEDICCCCRGDAGKTRTWELLLQS